MLTQEQLEKLQPLMEHPRFGNLLKDAVKVWSQEDISPASGIFGISTRSNSNTFELRNKFKKQCCLLGAALLDKDCINFCFYDSTQRHFNLMTIREAIDLQEGFDGWSNDTEARQFGSKVREIVIPNAN